MRLTVLGGCGAWPAADQACSGYLVEHDGFRLLIDPGYAILPRLLQGIDADKVDAVLVSHGHPDHCADLNPLLRARTFRDDRPPAPAEHSEPHRLTLAGAARDEVQQGGHAAVGVSTTGAFLAGQQGVQIGWRFGVAGCRVGEHPHAVPGGDL